MNDRERIIQYYSNQNQPNKIKRAFKKYESGKPVQYIIGNVDFYHYNFFVKKGVLIPRFVTEQLVEETLKRAKKMFSSETKILDIGCGSGVIGLSLAKEIVNSKVDLIDISSKAINLTKNNAKKLKVKCNIYKSYLLNKIIKNNSKFNIIISNPPYLKKDEEVMEIVLRNEPKLALFAKNDGLYFYEEILKNISKVLEKNFLICFEIGANQAPAIRKIVKKYLSNVKIEVIKDLEKRNRILFIYKNN